MSYRVKHIFETFQGEGFHAGRRAIFIRLAGCNLWNGLPAGRAKGKGACARWCDTDFVGGTRYTAENIAAHVEYLWGVGDGRFAVITGGEPGLQLEDPALVHALQEATFDVAVETNGTVDADGIRDADWVTLSPKLGGEVKLSYCPDELKVVLPGHADFGAGWTDEQLEALRQDFDPDHCYVNPMDPISEAGLVAVTQLTAHIGKGAELERNQKRCQEFVAKHPHWRLGAQLHKFLALP